MIIETISALVILGIALFFSGSESLSMPQSVMSMLIVGILISFLVFAGFIFKEKGSDERESMHILAAGRISYLVGVATLIIGIIFQALKHSIDPILVIALCAMVFTKLIFRIYSHFKM